MKSEEIKEIGLCIIESLRADDKKTGKILYDNTIKYKVFQEPNLSRYYFQINSKKEFFETLKLLIEKIKVDKLFPLLHFETHGGDEGIQLNSSEVITWEELHESLIEINLLLENKLAIYLGMCYGNAILSAVNPSKRASFRIVFGISKEIDESVLLVGFETFYNNFFFSFNPEESLSLMNKEIEGHGVIFSYTTAEQCFDYIIDTKTQIFKQNVSRSALVMLRSGNFRGKSYKELRIIAEQELINYFEKTRSNKSFFLMEDIISQSGT